MSANPSLGGFGHAPVSKVLVFSSGLSSILLQASKASRGNHIASRIAIKWLSFEGPAELLFSAFLLYYFRTLERQIGSAKYAAYVVVVSLLSWAFSQLASSKLGLSLPGGPYGLISASFVQYFFTVPSLSKFSVLGWRLNDKAFVYLCGLQLCLSGGLRTVVASAAGLLAGIIYRSNVFGLRNLKVPAFLCRLASATIGRFIESAPPPQAQPGQPGQPAAAQRRTLYT